MHLLHIDSSISGAQSVSRQLTASIVARLKEADPSLTLTYRDLVAEPLPHLSEGMWFAKLVTLHQAGLLSGEIGNAIAVALTGGAQVDPSARSDLAVCDAALEEFLAADVIVLGAPMYNFSVPSQLKAWIDAMAAPGKTFRYSEKGPVGLASAKKVIVASARGGVYSAGSPMAFMDYHEPFLSGFFRFIGVTDLTFVRAEGLSVGPEQRQAGLESAEAVTPSLAA